MLALLLGCGNSFSQENWKMKNSNSPKVLLFEVCPDPDMQEETEARDLHYYFNKESVTFSIVTNDNRWPKQTKLSKEIVEMKVKAENPEIIHLAIHGLDTGLVISSEGEKETILSVAEMEKMTIWKDKIVVSGACEGGKYTERLLARGAMFVLASERQIPWQNLGKFFTVF